MSATIFETADLAVGYPRLPDVISGLDLELPEGAFTAVIGPNGCGKSTLLLTLGRLLAPRSGVVRLRGQDIAHMRPRHLAQTLAFLPQHPFAPDGIRVHDLVLRGRQPYRRFLAPPTADDQRAVAAALDATGTRELADRELASLSGGQRQRAWIAMILAQDTDVVLLDEPTSFLDITHQIDVLEICASLVRTGRSVLAVLHDLGLAARYADHLVVMQDGHVAASGPPADVVTSELLEEVFALPSNIITDPETGTPLVIPRRRDDTTVRNPPT